MNHTKSWQELYVPTELLLLSPRSLPSPSAAAPAAGQKAPLHLPGGHRHGPGAAQRPVPLLQPLSIMPTVGPVNFPSF